VTAAASLAAALTLAAASWWCVARRRLRRAHRRLRTVRVVVTADTAKFDQAVRDAIAALERLDRSRNAR
jgi:hypothetical protein